MMTTLKHSNVASLPEPYRDPVLIPTEQANLIPTVELVRRIKRQLEYWAADREPVRLLCEAARKSLSGTTDTDEADAMLAGLELLDLQRNNRLFDLRLLVTELVERTGDFHNDRGTKAKPVGSPS